MKTAILLVDDVTQIMFTPETEGEKKALKMIDPEKDIDVVIKHGSFTSQAEILGVSVDKCQGGFYRASPSAGSVMFVLTPKKEDENK